MVLKTGEGIKFSFVLVILAALTWWCGYYYGRKDAREECGRLVFEMVYGVEAKN